MFAPASRATTGSSTGWLVRATSATPTRTAAEVTTSVIRCLPSAIRVAEPCSRPFLSSTSATPPLISAAATEMIKPRPNCSGIRGLSSRSIEVAMMKAAAAKIITPSTAAEKYSALLKP